ncbi:cupin domain-containing protein [uncultured Sphaerochaeta sp.]|uniref:cupin domain-containing protein n=1 Tax=uncultured Sphaerochaeta sp. TaxID=886478 RepID=UPI00260E2F39|nr:cupin domain-containing protein [uncultured Sphaerochaeta sp.]
MNGLFKGGKTISLNGAGSNIIDNIRDMYMGLKRSSSPLLVPYSSLSKLDDGEEVVVADGVKMVFRKFVSGLTFVVEMDSGSKLSKHYHPDCIELIYVASGSVIDDVTGEVYDPKDAIYVNENTVHSLRALSPARLNVQYVKQPFK